MKEDSYRSPRVEVPDEHKTVYTVPPRRSKSNSESSGGEPAVKLGKLVIKKIGLKEIF